MCCIYVCVVLLTVTGLFGWWNDIMCLYVVYISCVSNPINLVQSSSLIRSLKKRYVKILFVIDHSQHLMHVDPFIIPYTRPKGF